MPESRDLRDELKSIITGLKSISHLGETVGPFESILKDLDRDSLRIGVIGITSAGKSTFLNVLLGKHLLPEQSKATTNMLVYCRKGPELRMDVIPQSPSAGKRRVFKGMDVSAKRVAAYCCEDENPRNEKGVEKVLLRSPDMLLLDKFELVDTPGIDAYGHEDHEELALRRFLPSADIVLYTTSIKYPIKKADARVLEQVLQNDQRVLFVQTFKDVVKDSHENGVLIKTRQQELEEYLKRIRNDVRKCAPRLKAQLFCQVSSYLAKHAETYGQSGFNELLEAIHQLGKELESLIQERLSGRILRHLDLCLGGVSELASRIEGDREAARRNEDRRKQRCEDLLVAADSLKRITGSIETLDHEGFREALSRLLFHNYPGAEHPLPEALSSHSESEAWWKKLVELANELNAQDSDAGFVREWRKLLAHLQSLQPMFLESCATAESDCTAVLSGLKIDPFHHDTKTLNFLPQAPEPQWETVTKIVKKHPKLRRIPIIGRLVFDGNRTEAHKRLDKRGAKKNLQILSSDIGKGVNEYIEWWREKHCAHRYLAPVMEEISSAENLIGAADSKSAIRIKDLRRVENELIGLRERISDIEESRQKIVDSESRDGVERPPEKVQRSKPHLLRQILHSRREQAFRRSLLGCVETIAGFKGRQSLLCLGGKAKDHKELVALLTHRLKDIDTIPMSPGLNVWCHPGDEAPTFFTRFTGEWERHNISRLALTRLSVVSHSPRDSNDRNLRWEHLFESVDAVGVFVNCSQIGSGLNDIEESDWIMALSEFKPKVFFIGLDMSYYRESRGHELVTQVLPALRMSSLGDRPYMLTDAYEVRFTVMARYGDLLLRSFPDATRADWDQECRQAVLDWEAKKISLRPPFTKGALLETFKSIFDHRRDALSL